jgi:hypothetical protein
MVHHCLYHQRIFQNQNCAQEIVIACREFFENPQVRVVRVTGVSRVDNFQQYLFRDATLCHALSGMVGHDHGALETGAVHGLIEMVRPRKPVPGAIRLLLGFVVPHLCRVLGWLMALPSWSALQIRVLAGLPCAARA